MTLNEINLLSEEVLTGYTLYFINTIITCQAVSPHSSRIQHFFNPTISSAHANRTHPGTSTRYQIHTV
jgi:hypothetical protein